VTGDEFAALADRYAAGLNEGDASAAAACFAEDVDYHDPLRYHFGHRTDLLPFFEPPDGGHRVTWHRILFDEAAQAGLLEYTYEGQREGVSQRARYASGSKRAWKKRRYFGS